MPPSVEPNPSMTRASKRRTKVATAGAEPSLPYMIFKVLSRSFGTSGVEAMKDNGFPT